MKKKYIALLLFFTLIQMASAQNQANIWYFGNYCGLDFNSGIPVYNDQTIISSGDAISVMSDTNGSLLFCSNAERIVNREGHTMPNGGNLIGDHDASMGTLIVQQPGSGNLYYVFTVSKEFPDNNGMYYSVVDMNLDGGLGDVTFEKNVPLARAWAASNKLTSVRHANGEDVWIITRNFKTDQWYVAFLLTSNGLSSEGIISPVPWRTDMNNDGSMKVSPNKKYIAATYAMHGLQNECLKQSLDIGRFNTTSGEIDLLYTISKNPNNWTSRYWPQAVEFSPDSKLLYTTYYNSYDNLMELYQYDMQFVEDSLQFKESAIFIAQGPVQGLQLARDGKIYTTISRHGLNSEYLSVIHEPWKRGIDCNFQADAVYLGNDRKVYHYLPNMLLDHLYRFVWEGECAWHPIAFQPNFLPDMVSILWNFGDFQTSTEMWPVHYYENGGEYEVHVTVTYQNGRVEETSRVITVLNTPKPDLGPDTLSCEGEEIVLNAGNDEGFYVWSTGSFGENANSITVSDSGNYWVKATSSLGCSLSDSIYVGWFAKSVFLEDNLTITPTACGGSSGSISGLQAEGAEPLTYAWYDGNNNVIATTLDISNLAVGNYFLYVFDNNGCETISEAYTITDAGDIEISEVEFTDTHCVQNNGAIHITATSGAATDLLFSIDNGNNWQTDSIFTSLPAGNYFVRVSDQGDCETVYTNNPIMIVDIPGPEITNLVTTPENDYLADASIFIEALVGSGDILFSIDDGNTFQTNDGLFENLSAGTYSCMVKDDFGCDTTFTVVIDRILSQVVDAIAGDGYTCIGNATSSQLLLSNFTEIDSFHVQLTYDPNVIQCDGYIQVHPELENGFTASVIPAQGEVHITWKGESPTTLPENAKMVELVFSAQGEGVSQIDWKAEPGEGQFFNANGDEIAVNYELGAIRIYTRPNIMMMGSEQAVCEGDTVVISPISMGGSGEVDYFWEGPNNFTSATRQLIILGIHASQDGNYKFTVTDTIDCVESKTIDISVNPFPEIAFAHYDTIWAEPGYLLEAGNGAEYYQWNTGEITETIQIDSMGNYVVEVISYEGCKSSDAVHVLWGGGTPFYLPNAFTPNGDGLNDIFKAVPKYDYVSKYQLSIYNRWGQQLFETTGIDNGWDGNYNGKASPNGAYIYKIVYEEISQPEQSKTINGSLILIR